MKRALAIGGTTTLVLIALVLGFWSATKGDKPTVETHSTTLADPITTTTKAPILIPPTSVVRKTTTTVKPTTTTAPAKTTDTTTPNMPKEPTELQKRIPASTSSTTACPMECEGMGEDGIQPDTAVSEDLQRVYDNMP